MENKESIQPTIGVVQVDNIFKELLCDLTKGIMSGGLQIGLEKINQATEDGFTGFILKLLGGTTGTSLARIETELQEIKGMLSQLQVSVNTLIIQVTNISKQISEALFNNEITDLKLYYVQVNDLLKEYMVILDMCKDEKGNAKELNDYEQAKINDKISTFMELVRLTNIPEILTALNVKTVSNNDLSIYHTAIDYFEKSVPFKHQMYGDMYSICNSIATIRTIGLYVYYEYQCARWLIATKEKETILTQKDWMENHYNSTYNSSILSLNKEIENTPLLNEISKLIIKGKADGEIYIDKDTEIDTILKYFQNTINEKLTVVDEKGTTYQYDVFSIESNGSDSCSRAGYAVVKQAINLSVNEVGVDPKYYYSNRLIYSLDHRYKAAEDTSHLESLLGANKGNDQVKYLFKNLPGLDAGGNGFVLKSDEKAIIFKTTNDTRAPLLYAYGLNLLDANNCKITAAPEWIKIGKKKVKTFDVTCNKEVSLLDNDKTKSGESVYKQIALKDMKFYNVFLDTNIKYSAIPLDSKTGYYTPTMPRDMPLEFNMDNGDVLNLSALSGSLNERTINISGNARIIGHKNQLSNININLYHDAVLTLENIDLIVSKDFKINVKSGTGTIITSGHTELKGDVTPICTEIGTNIIIKAENSETDSLSVTCTSDNPAISCDGEVRITGIPNLTVSSNGATAIKTKGTFMASFSTITSIVMREKKETRTIYKDEVYGKLTIKTADIKNADTNSQVLLSIVYDNGKRRELQCIDSGFEQNSNEVFTVHLGRVGKVKNIEGLIVKSDYSGDNAGWKVDSIKLESLDDRTPIYLMFFPKLWIVDNTEKLFGVKEDTNGLFEFTVRTTDVNNAGTDSNLYVQIQGTKCYTERQNIKNITDYDAFEKGNIDVFSVGYSTAIGIPQKIIIESDGNGGNPAWHCGYIHIRALVPNDMQTDNKDTQKYYFEFYDWIESGKKYTIAVKSN